MVFYWYKWVIIMSIYDRINVLIEEAGITRTEFCKRTNINYVTITAGIARNSSGIKISTLKKIAEFFNVSADYLIGISDTRNGYSDESFMTLYNQLNSIGQMKAIQYMKDIRDNYPVNSSHNEENTEDNSDIRMLPLYEYPASAGNGIYCGEGQYELAPVPDEAPASTSFGVRISGKSMEPDIPDGSIVWIRQQPDVDIGEICIVIINEEGYCKQRGKHEFISINPEHKNIRPSKYDDVRISGLVVYVQPPDEQ